MPTKRPMIHARAEGVERVASGPVQFGQDWPGVFIRGDHALKLATCIRHLQTEVIGTSAAEGWAIKFLAELAAMIEEDIDTRSSV